MSIIERVSKTTGIKPDDINMMLDAFCDEIGWPEISAFNAECRKGQSVNEDAGGYLIRCIKSLLCGRVTEDEVMTYRKATKALIKAARVAP
jgi:hypothetical protein